MDKDTRSRVRACQTCALSKPAQTPIGDRWPLRSHKGRSRKFYLIMWVTCRELKPAIRPYSSVLMPFLSSFGWFLLGKRRLE